MGTRLAAYEIKSTRDTASPFVHPDIARINQSNGIGPWVTVGAFKAVALTRGNIPQSAYNTSGDFTNAVRVEGTATGSIGSAFIEVIRGSNIVMINGVPTANGTICLQSTNTINIGAGYSAPGTCLVFGAAALTALKALDATETPLFYVNAYESNVALGAGNVQNSLAQPMWDGLQHFCDFEDDEPANFASEGATRLFSQVSKRAGGPYTLPDGTVLKDCAFAGLCPTGTIYIAAEDYGITVPSDVTANTATAFRNHPAVFVRRPEYIAQVARRYLQTQTIVTPHLGSQPVGIYTASSSPVVTQSKWLIIADGGADIVQLVHPAGTNYRRPRDIWNQVIVPLVTGQQTNTNAPALVNSLGGVIGNRTRWTYLEYARFLGPQGDEQQSNTALLG